MLARLGTTQRRHTTRVVGGGFAQGGDAAVTVQADGLVRFWDPDTGRQVRTFGAMGDAPGDDRSVRQLAVAPDGRYMAAVGFVRGATERETIRVLWVWTLPEGRLLHRIQRTGGPQFYSVALSSAGGTVATGSAAGEVALWDLATGDSTGTIKVGDDPVHWLVLAADGKTLATGAAGKGIRLWDLAQGTATNLARPVRGETVPLLSHDGQLMVVSSLGGEVVVLDRQTGREQFAGPGIAHAFAPDGRSLIMTASDGTILRIDAQTGRPLWKLDLGGARPGGAVMAFSPDGTRILAECAGVLRFFEADTGREQFAGDDAHQGSVTALAYAPDGKTLFSSGGDGTIRAWDPATARQRKLIPRVGTVLSLAVSPDGKSLAAASVFPQSTVEVWDLLTGRKRQSWRGKIEVTGTEALAFSPDGQRILFYSRAYGLTVSEVSTGRELPAVQPRFGLAGGTDPRSFLGPSVFAPENRFLAIQGGMSVHVADVASGEERFSGPSLAMAFAPAGEILAVATPVDPASGNQSAGLPEQGDGIELLEITTGKQKQIAIAPDHVSAVAVSPSGKVVAVETGWRYGMIRLYDTGDGRELGAFACPATRTYAGAIAFSPDGASLAAGLDDTTVVIWDVRNTP